MTFPLKIIGNLKTKVDKAFKLTIDTSLGTGNTIQLPLPNETMNFVVNWGDSNEDTITAYNQAETLHTYAATFSGQISITGKCGGWSFNNGGDRLKVVSIDNWGDVQFDYIRYCFYGCSNLASFADDGIKGTTNAQDLLYFARGCTSLVLTNNNTNLFDGLPNIKTLQQSFQSCTSLTIIPTGLLSNNTTFTDCRFMFFGLSGLTGNSQELWLTGQNNLIPPLYNSGTPIGDRCYNGCTGLDDYATIPSYWK